MSAALKLEKARERIVGIELQLADPALTNFSRAELRDAIHTLVSSWHVHAADRVHADLQRLAAGGSANLLVSENGIEDMVALDLGDVIVDSRSWLTFAVGETEMCKRFETLINGLPEGLSARTRTSRLAQLQRELDAAEADENDAILEVESQGAFVDPRPGQRAQAAIVVGFGR